MSETNDPGVPLWDFSLPSGTWNFKPPEGVSRSLVQSVIDEPHETAYPSLKRRGATFGQRLPTYIRVLESRLWSDGYEWLDQRRIIREFLQTATRNGAGLRDVRAALYVASFAGLQQYVHLRHCSISIVSDESDFLLSSEPNDGYFFEMAWCMSAAERRRISGPDWEKVYERSVEVLALIQHAEWFREGFRGELVMHLHTVREMVSTQSKADWPFGNLSAGSTGAKIQALFSSDGAAAIPSLRPDQLPNRRQPSYAAVSPEGLLERRQAYWF